ncbi:CHAT domain-containing protein [Leptothermofonsia sp. ETS-13]|uniref:CHAT domain-containing protein n=1 Tax=Leptothermofonsia sp. ETS-13 TaxID=3035696 RepID=UPI003B9F15F9
MSVNHSRDWLLQSGQSIQGSLTSYTRRSFRWLLAIATALLFLIAISPTLAELPASPALLDQGTRLYEAGQFEQAAETWQKAAAEFDQRGDRLNAIRSRINQAQALKSLGVYRAAIEILEAQNQQVAPDSPEKVQILRSLSDAYLSTGEPAKAREVLNFALAFVQKQDVTQEWVNSEKSNLYFTLGLIDRAEFNRLPIQNLLLDSTPESQQAVESVLTLLKKIRQDFQQATGTSPLMTVQAELNQISLLVTSLPQFNQILLNSLGENTTALEELKDLPVTLLQDFFNVPTLKHEPNLASPTTAGNLQKYTALNAFKDETVQLMADLLMLVFQVRTPLEGLPPSQAAINARLNFAQSLTRLRLVATSANDVERQLVTLQRAFELSQGKKPAGAIAPKPKPLPPPFLAEPTQRELQNLIRTSLQEAASVLKRVVVDAQTLKNQRAEAYALAALAELYGQQAQAGQGQNWSDVATLSRRAMLLAQESNAPEIAYRVQRLLGRALKEQGNIQSARSAYRLAARTLQSVRGDLVGTNQDLQYDFRDSVEPVYREAVEVLLPAPGEQPNQQDLEEARQFIESLQLAELDNFLREACVQGQKVALDQVVDQNNPNTAVIYPIILPKQRLGVIAKIPGQKALRYHAFENLEVESILRQFQSNLRIYGETNQLKTLAQTVYRWLIEPFQAELEQGGVDTLVFVPDGSFRNVPMAALFDDRNGKYLIQEYAIAISPGLQLFDPKFLAQTRLNVLAAGKSDFSDPKLNEKLPETSRGLFSNLDEVATELKTLEEKVQAQILYESNFTSQTLKTNIIANPFNVVHIATHGVFGYRKDQTYIVADDGPINVDQLSEILRSRDRTGGTSIELLVLSACQTAEGDNRVTLGLSGIAVRAGARSAIGSLWSVNDKSTSIMMDKLYTELVRAQTTKITKAKALQAAQLSLLEDPIYRQPLFWAPFILVGNWL